MKAILEHDHIRSVCVTDGLEIGDLPPGVGLERLRFDGQKVVDLAELKRIWVRDLGGGAYSLHAVELPSTQAVEMTYADRRRLTTTEQGIIRLLTQDELIAQSLVEDLGQEKNRLRRRLVAAVGDQGDQLADLTKLVYALVTYVLTTDEASKALLQALLPDIQACYPSTAAAERLKSVVPAMSSELQAYYDRKADIEDKSPIKYQT